MGARRASGRDGDSRYAAPGRGGRSEREDAVIDWLLEPFALSFMQRALVAAVVVGLVCSVLGCYVVLRSMAFLGDALAHAVLPGIALAYLAGVSLLAGAVVAALAVALGIGVLSRHGAVREDTAIGILFAAALSLGVLLISTTGSYATDLTHILFGDVLGVSTTDVWLTVGLAAVVLVAVLVLYRELLLATFDPVLAHTLGRRPRAVLMGLLVLLALTIVVSLQTVGVGLVAALLVTPGATASLLTRRLPSMMGVAALVGVASSVIGLYLSYYLDVASGAAIVLTATGFFVAAFVFAPGRGVVWRAVGARAG
jgi:manganese/iron transport system permease protein